MTPALDRLRRPFDHADVIAEQAEVGVGATVLVQAADNLDDTANMLRVARAHPQVAGVDGLAVLAERGLTFDVCAETAPLLWHVPTLAERHPALGLVADHLGKPQIRARGWRPWAVHQLG
jgi:L-fuconolactonase